RVASTGDAAEIGQRVGGDPEGFAADRRGGQAGRLERDAVGHGRGAARAAVADAGDDDVAAGGQFFDEFSGRGCGEVDLGAGHGGCGAVVCDEEPADLVPERCGVT